VRSINLLKVAAEAELLRLRTLLARQGRRAAFGVVAVIFMLGVLVLAEITGWQVLRLYVAPIPTTLILLGINFVIAALFGALAARSSPSHTEREALQVRRQALDAARERFPSPRSFRSRARFCASGAAAAPETVGTAARRGTDAYRAIRAVLAGRIGVTNITPWENP
jgi:hypothetical protein